MKPKQQLNSLHSHVPETRDLISDFTPDSLGEVFCGFSSAPLNKCWDSIIRHIMNFYSFPFLNNPDVQYYTTCEVTEFF